MPSSSRAYALAVIGILLAGCTGAASPSPSPTPTPNAPASASPSPSPSPSPDACAKANLQTKTSGKLTVGAGNPAYPPYFQPDPKAAGWDLGNPNNGKGLESATAYAVAQKLGFAQADVSWISVVFDNAVQPGAKKFDIYLSEVSYSADRAKIVDLSDGYFDLNQAVVALKSNPIAQVTDVAGLKAFTLGTQAGTSSFKYITDAIQPTKTPRSYNSLDAALAALKARQIDGIVADLPTTFYMRDAQLTNAVIVGSLPTVGTVEHYSILLAKGSPLTACVNGALAALKSDGTLAGIVQQWITSQGAPALK